MDAGDNDDSMQAVRFAADYPFRTGASKNIILLPCDACLENAVTYAEMQRLLLAKDIRLHVLMQHDIKLRGGKSAKQAFGEYALRLASRPAILDFHSLLPSPSHPRLLLPSPSHPRLLLPSPSHPRLLLPSPSHPVFFCPVLVILVFFCPVLVILVFFCPVLVILVFFCPVLVILVFL